MHGHKRGLALVLGEGRASLTQRVVLVDRGPDEQTPNCPRSDLKFVALPVQRYIILPEIKRLGDVPGKKVSHIFIPSD